MVLYNIHQIEVGLTPKSRDAKEILSEIKPDASGIHLRSFGLRHALDVMLKTYFDLSVTLALKTVAIQIPGQEE